MTLGFHNLAGESFLFRRRAKHQGKIRVAHNRAGPRAFRAAERRRHFCLCYVDEGQPFGNHQMFSEPAQDRTHEGP